MITFATTNQYNMKKLYILLFLALFSARFGWAQTIILSENFTTYDSLSGSGYNGWYLSYSGAGSYYFSNPAPAGSAGPSGPNTYKFGRDSTTAITPMFSGADSVHFFMKGNPATGGTLAQSTFYVYESADSITWTSVHTFMPPISTVNTGSMQHFPLLSTTKWLKFFYDKDTGNVAFDDFSVTSSVIGLNTHSFDQTVNLYPTPTDGLVNIIFNEANNATPVINVYNLLGSKITDANVERINASRYSIDLGKQHPGLYLVKIQTAKGTLTRRVTVK